MYEDEIIEYLRVNPLSSCTEVAIGLGYPYSDKSIEAEGQRDEIFLSLIAMTREGILLKHRDVRNRKIKYKLPTRLEN